MLFASFSRSRLRSHVHELLRIGEFVRLVVLWLFCEHLLRVTHFSYHLCASRCPLAHLSDLLTPLTAPYGAVAGVIYTEVGLVARYHQFAEKADHLFTDERVALRQPLALRFKGYVRFLGGSKSCSPCCFGS